MLVPCFVVVILAHGLGGSILGFHVHVSHYLVSRHVLVSLHRNIYYLSDRANQQLPCNIVLQTRGVE